MAARIAEASSAGFVSCGQCPVVTRSQDEASNQKPGTRMMSAVSLGRPRYYQELGGLAENKEIACLTLLLSHFGQRCCFSRSE